MRVSFLVFMQLVPASYGSEGQYTSNAPPPMVTSQVESGFLASSPIHQCQVPLSGSPGLPASAADGAASDPSPPPSWPATVLISPQPIAMASKASKGKV